MPNKIFISYCHKDKKWLGELKTHLTPLFREKEIIPWEDTQIEAGELWRDEIEKAISEAQIAILLVTPDFLASKFIAENELPRLLGKARQNTLTIFWIAVIKSTYGRTAIEKYQAANDPTKPVGGLSKRERDDVWVEIVEKIAKVIESSPHPIEHPPPLATSGLLSSPDPPKPSPPGNNHSGEDLILPDDLRRGLKERIESLTRGQRDLLEFIARISRTGKRGRGLVSHLHIVKEFAQKFSYSEKEIFFRLEHLRLLCLIERRQDKRKNASYRLSDPCDNQFGRFLARPPFTDFENNA